MTNHTSFGKDAMQSNSFFDAIEAMTSEIEVEILKAQGINNPISLLRAQDLYSIFQIDCEELQDLKSRACLKLKNGEYTVRPAIKTNLDYCINFFKHELNAPQEIPSECHPSDSNTQLNYFVNTFLKSITDNMIHSKNRYRYNDEIRRFASAVFILGGHNVYELLRINLPGAFPSITKLESYNNDYCTKIEEGEFRFKELIDYSNKINCSYVYASEDCTGIISKVNYDVENNLFVGFCPRLINGLPTIRQYQTDDFFQLEEWFETVKQSTLVNTHMIQPITTAASPPFLLSSFGTDNKCDSFSILRRWLFIHEQCSNNNIKIVGFSSDAYAKYLRVMRLVTG